MTAKDEIRELCAKSLLQTITETIQYIRDYTSKFGEEETIIKWELIDTLMTLEEQAKLLHLKLRNRKH